MIPSSVYNLGGVFVLHTTNIEELNESIAAQKMWGTRAKVAAFVTSTLALVLRSSLLSTTTILLTAMFIVLDDLRDMNQFVQNSKSENGILEKSKSVLRITGANSGDVFRMIAQKAQTVFLKYFPRDWMHKSWFPDWDFER